jgi:hypothetical protein
MYEYGEVTRVTIQIANPQKIDESIDALKTAMKNVPIAHHAALCDMMNILTGTKKNYQLGRDCTKHPVMFGRHSVKSDDPINCPFCGGDADADCGNTDAWIAYCEDDDCIGHIVQANIPYATRKQAVDAWNMRMR